MRTSYVLGLGLMAVVASCSGGVTDPGGGGDKTPSVLFSELPTNKSITVGNEATVTITAANVQSGSCQLTVPAGVVANKVGDNSWTIRAQDAGKAGITVQCTGVNGASVSAKDTLTVYPMPTFLWAKADNLSVLTNDSLALQFSASNAASVQVKCSNCADVVDTLKYHYESETPATVAVLSATMAMFRSGDGLPDSVGPDSIPRRQICGYALSGDGYTTASQCVAVTVQIYQLTAADLPTPIITCDGVHPWKVDLQTARRVFVRRNPWQLGIVMDLDTLNNPPGWQGAQMEFIAADHATSTAPNSCILPNGARVKLYFRNSRTNWVEKIANITNPNG